MANTPTPLHVWDATTRRDRRTVPLTDGNCADDIAVSPDGEAFSCGLNAKLALDANGNQTIDDRMVIFDKTGPRFEFPRSDYLERPSYSSNAKWIAYAYNTYSDRDGSIGKIAVIDRTTHKVQTQSVQGSLTLTRFSHSNKLLVVGDGLGLVILDLPSLHVRARTQDVRPPAPGSADLDLISDIEIIGNDVGVWAIAQEPPDAVFRLPSGTVDPHLQRPDPTPSQAELAKKRLETLLDTTACTMAERVYPIAACQ